MSFIASNAEGPSGDREYSFGPVPVPKEGSRKARVSLIVDMGIQDREDYEDPDTGETRPQKPSPQVAVFLDLTADTVDYGGTIGKAHYRLMVNKSFLGKITGIQHAKTAPKDAKGNTIQGKPWAMHPANALTKIAKATGQNDVIESTDISKLLDQPLMAQVEVKKTPDKNGKKDKDGNTIVYTNVNFKGASQVPNQENDAGEDIGPMPVPALKTPALCITFKNAKAEDIKFIRAALLKQIKLAHNYAGSQMEKAVQAFEAAKAEGADSADGAEEEAEAEAPVKAVKPAAKATKPKAPVVQEDDDDSVPF